MPIMPYDKESQSRNADYISIAAERQSATLGPKGRCPLSASEHNPPPSGGHNPRGEAPSTFPSEPSGQQPIHLKNLIHYYFVFTIMTKAILPSLYSTVRGMERREESSRAMERPMP